MADNHPLIRYPPSNNSLLSNTTKKAIAYEPRTEAISPAINDDMLGVETSDASKSTKDEQTLLVEKLKKVEADIVQTDLQINRLRKQKQQLEQQAASSANRDDDDQENVCDTKQLSIAKLVYHENRAKAQKAHAKLDSFNGINRDLPLYNQPSDNAIYHYTAAKFTKVFKTRLIACFRERLQTRLRLEESVSSEYDRRMEKWLKKIELEDSQPHKRVVDARVRDFFEKQFPELKRARESGERFSRVGQRVARSDAEFDELLDGIAEREDRDKKVKSYAVIPPMLEEMRSKKPKYLNRNGYVEDIIAEYKEYQMLNTWTDEEKELFRENYLQHPKNFALIANVTSRKNTANCVQYYYLSKKGENYKQWVKRQQKRKTRSFGKPAQQALPPPPPTTNSNNNDSSETNNKTTNGVQDKTNNNDSQDAQNQDPMEQSDLTSKLGALDNSVQKQSNDRSLSNANQNILDSTTCFLCGCEFNQTNQFRNVTRSNHQLYGIAMDLLKPGMRICYPCRFRHIRHPNFDEPSSSPELYEEEEDDEEVGREMEEERAPSPMDVDLAEPSRKVFNSDSASNENCTKQQIFNDQINVQDKQSGPALGDASKSVRDMIDRAIEIGLEKPKVPEFLTEANIKTEPARTEVIQLNPMTPQLNIPNALPLKPVSANHAIPPPNPLPPHLPIQSLAVDPQHLQVQMQQKQQQMQIEYNIRHQQYLSQQLQQQQQQQQQQLQQQQQQQQLQIEINLRQQQYLSQQLQLQQHQHQQHQHQQQLLQQHQQLQQQLQHLPRLQQPPHQPQPPPPPPSQLHHIVRMQQPPPPTSPATKQFIRPAATVRMPPVQAPSSTHPLDFSRKYVEPPPLAFTEPIKSHVIVRPPPMAHGARTPKTPSSHGGGEQGVLNLSKPSPATTPGPVAVSMPPMTPVTPINSMTPLPPITPVSSMPHMQPMVSMPQMAPAVPAPMNPMASLPPQASPLAPLPPMPPLPPPPPPPPQASAPPERHPPSHSPNLTGSPSSPMAMVIDESASPNSSREDDQ